MRTFLKICAVVVGLMPLFGGVADAVDAFARLKIWSAGEVLKRDDLEAEFNNIINQLNAKLLADGTTFTVAAGDSLLVRGRIHSDTTWTGIVYLNGHVVVVGNGLRKIGAADARIDSFFAQDVVAFKGAIDTLQTFRMVPGQRITQAPWARIDTLGANTLLLGNLTSPAGYQHTLKHLTADTLQSFLMVAGQRATVRWAQVDTLQTFLMVAGQRATTKYVASDTLLTNLLTGLTDTNTGLSWLGADSLALVTGGSNRLIVGASGNVFMPGGNFGVSVTPNASRIGAHRAIELPGGVSVVGHTGQNSLYLTSNAYHDAVGWKYHGTGAAAWFELMNPGGFQWSSAPSGTAGNAITWSQNMTLSPGGRFAVGSTDTTLAKALFYDNTALSIPVGYFFQDNASATGAALQVRTDAALTGALKVAGTVEGIVSKNTGVIANGDSVSVQTLLGASNKPTGALRIISGDGRYYEFFVRGSSNGVYEVSDPSTSGSITKGTGSSLNVYFSVVAQDYYIENLIGSELGFLVTFIGAGGVF